MSLSKIIQEDLSFATINTIFGIYNQMLRKNPLLTKSATSAVISALGPVISQVIQKKEPSWKIIRAFLIYGGVITGPITHAFYNILEKLYPGATLNQVFRRLATERLVFAPAFMFLTLYLLSRLQGQDHNTTLTDVTDKYIKCLKDNWKIWTIPQLVNISMIPPQYRVLFANLVALIWNIHLARLANSKKDME